MRDCDAREDSWLENSSSWGTPENLMFVVGATQTDELTNIRKITSVYFYLFPALATQDRSLKGPSEKAMIKDCGILVNASRSIIYAGEKNDLDKEASAIAQQYHLK